MAGARVATVGPTYFGHKGVRTEIDHILTTRHCQATRPAVMTSIGEHVLCSQAGSISDHAVLMCDLECVPEASRTGVLHEVGTNRQT